MPISEVFNIDCMEYMRKIPDGFFDLAVVDPPYGDGLGGGNPKRFGGMFRASIDGSPTRGGGARSPAQQPTERRAGGCTDSGSDSTSTNGRRASGLKRWGGTSIDTNGRRKNGSKPVSRVGGAGRNGLIQTKKLSRGTSLRGRSIFKSFSASHATKLSGAGTISTFRRRAASASSGRPISRRRASPWRQSSMPGRHSTETPC